MSVEPESAADELDAESVRDARWLAAGVWAATLVALLITSYAGIVGPTSNIDLTLISLDQFREVQGTDGDGPNTDLIAVSALILTGAIAVVVLLTWVLFARMTAAIVGAFSDAGTLDEEPTASAWLFPGGARSMVSDLMLPFGVTWALLIVRPVVIGALRLLTA